MKKIRQIKSKVDKLLKKKSELFVELIYSGASEDVLDKEADKFGGEWWAGGSDEAVYSFDSEENAEEFANQMVNANFIKTVEIMDVNGENRISLKG